MKLYELTIAYQMLLDAEDSEEFALGLAQIEDEIMVKAEGIAAVIRTLEGEATIAEVEAKRLREMAQSRQNRVESLKQYLLQNLQVVGMKQVKTARWSITVQNSPPKCNLVDGEAIPETYRVNIPATWRPDAKAIIEAYKRGETVPGAEVSVGQHLVIR